jgi:hypothetical protein
MPVWVLNSLGPPCGCEIVPHEAAMRGGAQHSATPAAASLSLKSGPFFCLPACRGGRQRAALQGAAGLPAAGGRAHRAGPAAPEGHWCASRAWGAGGCLFRGRGGGGGAGGGFSGCGGAAGERSADRGLHAGAELLSSCFSIGEQQGGSCTGTKEGMPACVRRWRHPLVFNCAFHSS